MLIKSVKFNIILSFIGVLASIIAGILAIFPFPEKKESDLYRRIGEVENAIINIRNLENYLEKYKNEMKATSKQKRK